MTLISEILRLFLKVLPCLPHLVTLEFLQQVPAVLPLNTGPVLKTVVPTRHFDTEICENSCKILKLSFNFYYITKFCCNAAS